MKSDIKFTCTNSNCELFEQEIIIDKPSLLIEDCTKFFRTGKIIIKHGDETFQSTGVLVQYFKGLNKELKLLKKMIDSKIADSDEIERFKEIQIILEDAICPCCGKDVKHLS